MKKPISFFDKIKFFLRWMRYQEGYGLIATCGLCDSTRVKRVDYESMNVDEYTNLYQAAYECIDCGAVGTNMEQWNKTV